MRETCARALAAALMTAAMAFVLAVPAVFEPTHDTGRRLTAPPSSAGRSVHVPALQAAARPERAERQALTRRIRLPVVHPNAVPAHAPITRPASRTAGGGRSAPPKATPQPVPRPETRELTSTTPESTAEPPAPAHGAVTPVSTDTHPTDTHAADTHPGKGKALAKGHDKAAAPAQAETAPPQAAAAPPAPAPAEAPENAPQPSDDHGHGKGHAYGHAD
jgi:hypothetical protein